MGLVRSGARGRMFKTYSNYSVVSLGKTFYDTFPELAILTSCSKSLRWILRKSVVFDGLIFSYCSYNRSDSTGEVKETFLTRPEINIVFFQRPSCPLVFERDVAQD